MGFTDLTWKSRALVSGPVVPLTSSPLLESLAVRLPGRSGSRTSRCLWRYRGSRTGARTRCARSCRRSSAAPAGRRRPGVPVGAAAPPVSRHQPVAAALVLLHTAGQRHASLSAVVVADLPAGRRRGLAGGCGRGLLREHRQGHRYGRGCDERRDCALHHSSVSEFSITGDEPQPRCQQNANPQRNAG